MTMSRSCHSNDRLLAHGLDKVLCSGSARWGAEERRTSKMAVRNLIYLAFFMHEFLLRKTIAILAQGNK